MTKTSYSQSKNIVVGITEASILLKAFEGSSQTDKATYGNCQRDFEPSQTWNYYAGRVSILAYLIGQIDHSTQDSAVQEQDVEYQPFIGILPANAATHVLTLAMSTPENTPYDIGIRDMAVHICDMLNIQPEHPRPKNIIA